MKKLFTKSLIPAAILLTASIFTSCASTGRGDSSGSDMDVISAITASVLSIEKASLEITPEEEYYSGRSVAANICATYPIDHGSYAMTSYLNKIAETIVMNSPKPFLSYNEKGYNVVILDSDEINAMATPGGHIFISRGLIDCTDSEDALAAVIAHEIAHIQLGHSVEAIKANRIRAATADTGKAIIATGLATVNTVSDDYGFFSDADMKSIYAAVDTISNASNEVLTTLVNTGYSQAQEFEADKEALYLLFDAGYDPNAMLDMLSQLDESPSNSGWGATHPAPKERIKKVQKELSKIAKNKHYSVTGRKVRTERFESEYKDYRIFELD